MTYINSFCIKITLKYGINRYTKSKCKKIELDNSVLSDNKFLDQQDKLSNDLEKLDGVSSVLAQVLLRLQRG